MNKKISIDFSDGVVFIAFLLCILKLAGVLTISWWWCFCLFWLPFAILFGIIGLLILIIIPYALIGIIINTFRK
jgi:hypothetical protein